MTGPAQWMPTDPLPSLVTSVVIFVAIALSVLVGGRPLVQWIRRQERFYRRVLQGTLLLDVPPRLVTVLTGMAAVFLGMIGWVISGGSLLGVAMGAVAGLLLPRLILRALRRRRIRRLDDQLVMGIQTLASGVRAGLNLVQSMELIARDGPVPIRQEFAHLLREYEYGVPLDEAMDNAAHRIGSSDYRLLFSALHTHRERGGDLGETLDRIAASIREIQRLEKRVQTLTAQGRATARWMGAMPLAVMVVLYLLVDKAGVLMLFRDDLGKLILVAIVMLNILGFLWIRKIMAIDI